MKKIRLSDGQEATCDDEDYEYLAQFEWHAMPVEIHGKKTYYAYRRKGRRIVYMHEDVIRRAGGFGPDGRLRRQS